MNTGFTGILSVFAAAAAWGMSGIFVTNIIDASQCSSVSLAFWRDLASFVLLFILFLPSLFRQTLDIRMQDLPCLMGMGGFLGLFHIFYNKSVMLNGASITTVDQAAMPAVVSLAAWYLWKESLDFEKIAAMVLIFAGTVMASGLHSFDFGKADASGLMAGFCVPVLYAGWTLCGKTMVNRYGPNFCLMIAFGTAAFLLFFLQPFTAQPVHISLRTIMLFSGLIVFSTIGAFTLYMVGLQYIQAGVAGILAMSEIIFAGVYARFLLGEHLDMIQICGAGLVITGVVGLSYFQAKKQKS